MLEPICLHRHLHRCVLGLMLLRVLVDKIDLNDSTVQGLVIILLLLLKLFLSECLLEELAHGFLLYADTLCGDFPCRALHRRVVSSWLRGRSQIVSTISIDVIVVGLRAELLLTLWLSVLQVLLNTALAVCLDKTSIVVLDHCYTV